MPVYKIMVEKVNGKVQTFYLGAHHPYAALHQLLSAHFDIHIATIRSSEDLWQVSIKDVSVSWLPNHVVITVRDYAPHFAVMRVLKSHCNLYVTLTTEHTMSLTKAYLSKVRYAAGRLFKRHSHEPY